MRLGLDEKFLMGLIAGIAIFAAVTYWRGTKA